MKRLLPMIFLISILLHACNAETGIEISQAWARPALQDGNGAAYFLLQNHSATGDELTGVTSEAAWL